MSARKTPDVRPGAASTIVDRFVDVVTGEPYGDDEKWDVNGVDFIGVDPDGSLWWGTERAAHVLSDHWASVRVSGWIGNAHWMGHFVGTDAEAIDYAERHGVTVDHVESGETGIVYDVPAKCP